MDLSHGSRPIKSTLSNDPDMIELIQMYVEEMPERIAELERSWQGTRLDELTRFAHQLKGASAGYGFEQVGPAQQRQPGAGAAQVAIHGQGAGRPLHVGRLIVGAQGVRARVGILHRANHPAIEQAQARPRRQCQKSQQHNFHRSLRALYATSGSSGPARRFSSAGTRSASASRAPTGA